MGGFDGLADHPAAGHTPDLQGFWPQSLVQDQPLLGVNRIMIWLDLPADQGLPQSDGRIDRSF